MGILLGILGTICPGILRGLLSRTRASVFRCCGSGRPRELRSGGWPSEENWIFGRKRPPGFQRNFGWRPAWLWHWPWLSFWYLWLWSCLPWENGGKMDLDVLVVLGCQVKGRSPSRALLGRLQEAEKYLKENPETLAVLSGGQGYGEKLRKQSVWENGWSIMAFPGHVLFGRNIPQVLWKILCFP